MARSIERRIAAANRRADAAATYAAATIDALARAAFTRFWRLLQDNPGMDVREAIMAVQVEFGGQFAEALRESFETLLASTIGLGQVRALPVGDVSLSRRLYLHNVQTAAEVTALVRQHTQGVVQARELSLALYDGYSPADGIRRPLEGAARARLPRALRELTADADARRTLTALQVQGQQQAARLKTRALRAAYLEAFEAWEDGAGEKALRKRLQVALREKNRYFADRIAQTELHRAHQAQVAAELMDDVETTVVQVVLNPTHPRVDICDLHARADLWGLGPGRYPKAKAPRPPFHPFCLPGNALVSTGGRISAVTRRWYQGDMVVITTASGKRLEATVNHPVLTSAGWVAAGLIDVGGDVVSRLGPERVEAGDLQDQHMPTSIAKLFDSFGLTREVSTVEVPTAAPDFHGDGMAGQVAVVRADRKLWDGDNAALLQGLEDSALVPGLKSAAGLGLLRHVELPLKAPAAPSNSIVSSGGDGGLLARRKPIHSDLLLLGGGPRPNASPDDAGLESDPADAEIALKILEGSTGEVLADEVVSVHRYPVSCHVYNLETTTSHYTANGIVTHNCRCKLKSRPSQDAIEGRAAPAPAGAWLRTLSDRDQALVMGSRERADRVLMGEPAESVINEGKAPAHRLVRVGDARAVRHPLLREAEATPAP